MGCSFSTEVCDAAVSTVATTTTTRRQRPDFICCGVCNDRFDTKWRSRRAPSEHRRHRDDEPVRCIGSCNEGPRASQSEWYHRSCLPADDPRCPRCGCHALAAATKNGVNGQPSKPLRPMPPTAPFAPPPLPTFDVSAEVIRAAADHTGVAEEERDDVYRMLHGTTDASMDVLVGASSSSAASEYHAGVTFASGRSSVLVPCSAPASEDDTASASSSVRGVDGRDVAFDASANLAAVARLVAPPKRVGFALPEDRRASWACRICCDGQPHRTALRRRRNAITRMTNQSRRSAATSTPSAADEMLALVSLQPCGHQFHAHCLGEWMTLSVACPECGVVPTEQPMPVPTPSSDEWAPATAAAPSYK